MTGGAVAGTGATFSGVGVGVDVGVAVGAGVAVGGATALAIFGTTNAGDFGLVAFVDVGTGTFTRAGGSIGAGGDISPAVAGAGITGRRSFDASSRR